MNSKPKLMIESSTTAIFIHSLFRAGSTYFYNALKRSGLHHVYHEPFHEVIRDLPDSWEDLANRKDSLKALLRHGFLSGSYFDEYARLLPYIKKTFTPKLSYETFFLNAPDNHSELKTYINCLTSGAPDSKLPILQCTRTIGRIDWLRKNFSSEHIFLLRNPWDQWLSYKVDSYIAATPRVIYSQPNLPEPLRELMAFRSVSPLPGDGTAEKFIYAYEHPTPPDVDYYLFFGLWVYAFITAKRNCDAIFDMDEISANSIYRKNALENLSHLGIGHIDLEDSNLHRANFKIKEKSFYELIEEQVLEIFRHQGSNRETLKELQEYLVKQRARAFLSDDDAAEPAHTDLEDAVRMRELLLGFGKQTAQIATSLHQVIDDRNASVSDLTLKNSSRDRDIVALHNLIAEHERLITTLNEAIAERDSRISQFSESKSVLEAQLSGLNHAMAERERLIAALNEAIAERDSRIGQFSESKSGLEGQLDELNHSMAERERLIAALQEAIAERDSRIVQLVESKRILGARLSGLNDLVAERERLIATLNAGIAERDSHIYQLEESRGVLRAQLDALNNLTAERGQLIINLNNVLSERDHQIVNRDITINALRHSTSWKITAPLRLISRVAKGKPPTSNEVSSQIPTVRDALPQIMPEAPGPSAFFTICAKNFLAHARALYQSIHPHYPNARFFVVLCDRVDELFDPAVEPFEFVYLEDLSLPDLNDMAARYNITEFNTAVKPFAFARLMAKFGFESVVYLDPDLFFVDRMVELDRMLQEGAEAVLTPHLLQPAERDEIHDGKMMLFGIYNLGFLALRNTPSVQTFLAWWGRRLERDCVIRLEEGLFVDQKWADLLPAFVPGTRVLHHPGYNVAYWNLPQRKITRSDIHWFANGEPLRFVHFSGNKLDDHNVFSRHSQQVTIDNIGDLRDLLDAYREQVYEQGHAFYRSLPYAYSWNGASGINLHTPKELDLACGEVGGQSKRLLYLDWAIPKPDRDAASVTAKLLLEICDSLGYQVTFVPCGLQYEEGYYEDLVAANIEVIVQPATQSVSEWLTLNASSFDICILARGPVVWPYLATLKKVAPNLRLIFNTVDLHYVRELRQAELENDEKAYENALLLRDQEFELVNKCNLTILLSQEELYTVREINPEAAATVLPVVFSDIPGSKTNYAERRDILFIGSFPHQPNIDAVLYFAEAVFPIIRQKIPDIRFKVIGANPPESIQRLADIPGIDILGFVKDLEPVFSSIRLSVAPLRYGAGIKGKIGTSFCYGVPCVATTIAVEGMGLVDGRDVLVGDTPEKLAAAVCTAYSDPNIWNALSRQGHNFALQNYSVSAIQERVRNLLWATTEGWRAIHSAFELDDWESFQKHSTRLTAEYQRRIDIEQALLPTDGSSSFSTSGICCVCGRDTQFLTSFMYSTGTTPDGRPMPNWREHMQCQHCGLVNRMRAALHALHTIAAPHKESRIYITERITHTYRWLESRYPNLQGSEFLGADFAPGAIVDGIRNEDVMSLSFSDGSFDRVLSFDVLEHVPDPDRAFQEVYRVLDEKGVFLFSVPFSSTSQHDQIRATLNSDGTIEHHVPAEYHGNPVNPEAGALCFRYFGWDMLDRLRKIGFRKAFCLAYWSEEQGYLGREQYLFFAIK